MLLSMLKRLEHRPKRRKSSSGYEFLDRTKIEFA